MYICKYCPAELTEKERRIYGNVCTKCYLEYEKDSFDVDFISEEDDNEPLDFN